MGASCWLCYKNILWCTDLWTSGGESLIKFVSVTRTGTGHQQTDRVCSKCGGNAHPYSSCSSCFSTDFSQHIVFIALDDTGSYQYCLCCHVFTIISTNSYFPAPCPSLQLSIIQERPTFLVASLKYQHFQNTISRDINKAIYLLRVICFFLMSWQSPVDLALLYEVLSSHSVGLLRMSDQPIMQNSRNTTQYLQETIMPPVGFEPTIPADKRP